MASPTGNKWGGNQNGINFDANAEISVQKAASILMPQTKNGAVSEPRAGQTWKWLRIGAKIKYFREKRIKIGFSRDLPLEGGENNFPISDKKVSKEYWGRKFRSRYNFWSLSVRTSEKKIKISLNPQFWVFLAAYLLRRIFSSGG